MNNYIFTTLLDTNFFSKITLEMILIGFMAFCVIVGFMLMRANYLNQIKVALYMDVDSMLYNREGLTKFLIKKRNKYKNGTIVLVKIVNFKIILEAYKNNHALIEQICIILSKDLQASDALARLDYDTFAIVYRSRDKQETFDRMKKIEYNFQTYELANYGTYNFRLEFSVYDQLSKTKVATAVDHAFLPLIYGTPTMGNIYYYSEELGDIEEKLNKINAEKATALAAGEFVGFIQPKVSLETGQVCGGEMLVRWVDSNLKVKYYPDEFIPLFERNGFIANIDLVMLEQICIIQQGWKSAGKNIIPISFNLSRANFKNLDFVDNIKEVLNKYNVSASNIEVEITESAIMENFNFISSCIMQLKELGFKISMDDFGKEHSSLTTLIDNPFDVIKIDKLFLLNNLNIERERNILENLIHMITDIGISIVVEGVESDTALKYLCEMNNKIKVQGYCFSRPLPVSKFEVVLDTKYTVYPPLPKEEKVDIVEEPTKTNIASQNAPQNAPQHQSQPIYINNQPNDQIEMLKREIEHLKQSQYEAKLSIQEQRTLDEMEKMRAEIERLKHGGQHTQQPVNDYSHKAYSEIDLLRREIELLRNGGGYNSTRNENLEIERLRQEIELMNYKNIQEKQEVLKYNNTIENLLKQITEEKLKKEEEPAPQKYQPMDTLDLDWSTLPEDDDDEDDDDDDDEKVELKKPVETLPQIEALIAGLKEKYKENWDQKAKENSRDEYDKIIAGLNYYKEVNKNFMERMESTSIENIKAYNIVKNEIMKYKGVVNVRSKIYDKFKVNGEIAIKFMITRKCLKIYLSLNPNEYPKGQYHHKDVGNKKIHEKTPMMMKLKSALSVKKAMILVADIMTVNHMEINKNYRPVNFVNRNTDRK